MKLMRFACLSSRQTATNKSLEKELLEKYPTISEAYYVCSDTIGSVFTASPLGGMVLIAGTGSNALLRNPDGATYSCGGWGSALADEASGMFYLAGDLDHLRNLNPSFLFISVLDFTSCR